MNVIRGERGEKDSAWFHPRKGIVPACSLVHARLRFEGGPKSNHTHGTAADLGDLEGRSWDK
jgi:hypothetical protein